MTLTAESLVVGFPGRRLAPPLSFKIEAGQCWAVLGNNGSGKTTLMHVLAALRRPLGGEVGLDGAPISTIRPAARARRVGLLLQEEALEFWGTVLDYVCLGRYPHRRSLFGWEPDDERLAREQLERMDIGALAQLSLSTLSGGERQRARLALLLTQDPAFYLLDEPLQHLDLRHQLLAAQCFVDLARQRSRGVAMGLHDPRLARSFCDHALLLYGPDDALAGPAATVLTASNLERLYGVPVPL
jgi:iron complex transport system ATP-binding protein